MVAVLLVCFVCVLYVVFLLEALLLWCLLWVLWTCLRLVVDPVLCTWEVLGVALFVVVVLWN